MKQCLNIGIFFCIESTFELGRAEMRIREKKFLLQSPENFELQ